MAIRRKSGVIVVGFAASLFLARIFIVPALLEKGEGQSPDFNLLSSVLLEIGDDPRPVAINLQEVLQGS